MELPKKGLHREWKENMNKILSIVVPTYNVSSYLRKTLDSFALDDILDDIEVLIVNDGSTDKSAEIAMEYVNRYPKSYILRNKENGGHGSTINTGIDFATGKYFKVVDGDDWLDADGLKALVQRLKKFDVDLVLSPYLWYLEKEMKFKKEIEQLAIGVQSDRIYFAEESLNHVFLKMHALTFRTQILKEMPERLYEHCFYVDTQYALYPLPFVKTLLFIDKPVYMYRIGIEGQSMNIRNMQKRLSQHEMVLESLLSYYKEHKDKPCKVIMETTIARVATSQYKIYLSFKESHKEKLVKLDMRLKKEYPEIYRHMRNKAVLFLRMSRYVTYTAISCVVRKSLMK